MLTSIQLTECGQDDHVALAHRVEALAALLRGVRARDGSVVRVRASGSVVCRKMRRMRQVRVRLRVGG